MTEQPPHDLVREAFEAWARSEDMNLGRDKFLPGSPYMTVSTAGAWRGWVGATERAAQLCDAKRKEAGEGHKSELWDWLLDLAAAIRGG